MANIQRWINAHGQQEQIDITPNSFTDLSRELISLMGSSAYNEWVQTRPLKLQDDRPALLAALIEKLGIEKMEAMKAAPMNSDERAQYYHLRNIRKYSVSPASNRDQIISEILVKAGYTSLDQVKREYPHLWKEIIV